MDTIFIPGPELMIGDVIAIGPNCEITTTVTGEPVPVSATEKHTHGVNVPCDRYDNGLIIPHGVHCRIKER